MHKILRVSDMIWWKTDVIQLIEIEDSDLSGEICNQKNNGSEYIWWPCVKPVLVVEYPWWDVASTAGSNTLTEITKDKYNFNLVGVQLVWNILLIKPKIL